MSEWRNISGPDKGAWLDDDASAVILQEMLKNAPPLVLHPDGPELLDAHRDERPFYIEHGLIVGVWLLVVGSALWQWMF